MIFDDLDDALRAFEADSPREEPMSKKHKKQGAAEAPAALDPAAAKKARNKAYETELARLQVEIANLQAWVKASGARIVIIFEGRDAAGKGGMIKRLTEKVSPRVFRVVALPAPSDRQKTQLYMQRYIEQLPAAGEVLIFDRSWYNRPGVERVMGYCTEEAATRFLQEIPHLEALITESGILLLKYFLTVGEEEQERRFRQRIDDPVRQWKLSPMDLEILPPLVGLHPAYDEMLRLTDTPHAPWWIVDFNDKKAARINCLTHLLASIPYEKVKYEEPKLGKRQKRPDDYAADRTARNVVPDGVLSRRRGARSPAPRGGEPSRRIAAAVRRSPPVPRRGGRCASTPSAARRRSRAGSARGTARSGHRTRCRRSRRGG